MGRKGVLVKNHTVIFVKINVGVYAFFPVGIYGPVAQHGKGRSPVSQLIGTLLRTYQIPIVIISFYLTVNDTDILSLHTATPHFVRKISTIFQGTKSHLSSFSLSQCALFVNTKLPFSRPKLPFFQTIFPSAT
jgi:hypothetical protein